MHYTHSTFKKLTCYNIGTFLLEYAYIHPDLQPFVMTQLASVLALLTRFGWLDHEEYQSVYNDMTQFLQVKVKALYSVPSEGFIL
jgi:hypothetical protein